MPRATVTRGSMQQIQLFVDFMVPQIPFEVALHHGFPLVVVPNIRFPLTTKPTCHMTVMLFEVMANTKTSLSKPRGKTASSFQFPLQQLSGHLSENPLTHKFHHFGV